MYLTISMVDQNLDMKIILEVKLERQFGLIELKLKIQNYLKNMSMDYLSKCYSQETDTNYASIKLYLKPYDISIVKKILDSFIDVCEVSISTYNCYYDRNDDILSYNDDNLLKFFSKIDTYTEQQKEKQVNQIANNILEEIDKYEQQGDVE